MINKFHSLNFIKESNLLKITPADIIEYLTSKDWSLIGKNNNYNIVSKDNYRLKIPLHPDYDDYFSLVNSLVNKLAEIEYRNSSDIIHEISKKSLFDTACFNIDGDETDDGSAPFDLGIDIFESGYDAILFSSLSSKMPQKHYESKKGIDQQFANNIRLGQTEYGSFIARFLVPLNIYDDPRQKRHVQISGSPGRNATEYLINATEYLSKKIESNDLKSIVEPEKDSPQVSSNLCDAIYGMKPAYDGSKLVVSIRWSEQKQEKKVEIPDDKFERIMTVSKMLKPTEDIIERNFQGEVYGLHNYSQSDIQRGFVYINIIDKNKLLKVKVWLEGHEYSRAVLAHYEKREIKLSGILSKGQRISIIDKPANIDIIDPN